jgi:tetratricopeptide (TPR) repeat protein
VAAINRTGKNVPGKKRFSKRLWFGVIAALVLVTLPVLPLNPFQGFSLRRVDLDSVKEMIGAALRRPSPNDQSFEQSRVATSTFMPGKSLPAQDIRILSLAVEQLNQQLRRFPDDPSLHNRIGILCAELGEFTSAIEHFNSAVDLCHQRILALASLKRDAAKSYDPRWESSILAGSQLNVELSAAHSNLARIYDKLGQHDRVVAQLDQLNHDIVFAGDFSGAGGFGHGPVFPIGHEARLTSSAASGLARAQAYLQARRLPEAIREYQNLSKTEPSLAIPHQQLGLIYIRNNDLAQAIPELEAAIRLDPQDSNTRNNLGFAYLARGDKQLANAEFSRACSLDPKNSDAAINLANLLSENGQYEQAIQILESTLVFNPRCAAAHNNLASLLSLTGKLPESIAEFETALSLKPDMSTAHYGLGLAFFKSQSYASAIKEFKAALSLNPALLDAQNKLEQAYRKNELAVSSAAGIN